MLSGLFAHKATYILEGHTCIVQCSGQVFRSRCVLSSLEVCDAQILHEP